MWDTYPKTIILPQDKHKQEKLRKYMIGLRHMLPDSRVHNIQQLAIAVQILLLQQLFQEGLMVNTQTFLEEISDQNAAFYQLLVDHGFVFAVACTDLNQKCRNV